MLTAHQRPTTFWLDVYTLQETFDTPELIQNLAAFIESSHRDTVNPSSRLVPTDGKESILFLHVRAAADFFSSNKTLMQAPPAVDVDLILDPYVLNVFPKSLGSTAVYILVLATGAWPISRLVWQLLQPSATSKPHQD
jgi:hypothetical protein